LEHLKDRIVVATIANNHLVLFILLLFFFLSYFLFLRVLRVVLGRVAND
jgi:hypothetical protein